MSFAYQPISSAYDSTDGDTSTSVAIPSWTVAGDLLSAIGGCVASRAITLEDARNASRVAAR